MKSRRLPSILLAAGLVPAVLAMPVVTRPLPAPHPVRGHVVTAGLSGVDAGAWRTLQADESRARVRTGALDPRLGRPEALSAVRTAAPFTAIGVTWKPSPGTTAPVVNVRVRQDGRWTPWAILAPSDVGPDANSDEANSAQFRLGTEPLLTDPSDAYQVRVDNAGGPLPTDLRVDLVDPGTSAADANLTPTSPVASAEAQANAPAFITRAQWGADESIRQCCPRYMSTIKAGFVHHTASSNSYTAAGTAAQIRAIYLYHVKSNGWSDIGYNFLVDKYGRMFEGRYGGVSKAVKGAHTGGFNQDTFAVSALGNYDTTVAPAAMVSAIATIMAWKLDLYHRDPLGTARLTSEGGGTSRYAAGTTVTVHTISGHRDVGFTDCPGRYLYGLLATIRSKVKADMGPTLYEPRQSLTSVPATWPSPLVVSARTPMAQSWKLTVADPVKGPVYTKTGSTLSNTVSAAWPLTVNGAPAPPTTYTVTLTSGVGTVPARPFVTRVTIQQTQAFDPPPPAGTDAPYYLPGYRVFAGREWSTSCSTYQTTRGYRCFVYIKANSVVRTSTGFASVYGWVFDIVTYVDHDKPIWATDPLSKTGTFTSSGHAWKTSCTPNVTTGARTCTTWIWTTVLSRYKTSTGSYAYRSTLAWVLNNRVYLVP